jgi:hypothetical protein
MEETHNNAVSEQYRKYVNQILVKETAYLFVWGTDMADPEQQDKLLLDPENRILLFSRIDQIAGFVAEHSVPLYDAANFVPWLQELTGPDAYTVFDMDLLQTVLTSELSQSQILQNPNFTNDLINFFNLAGDYAYQIDEALFLKSYRKPQLRLFFDYCYDTYFWTIPPEELQQRQSVILKKFRFAKFKKDMNNLLTVFISRCRFIS